MVSSFYCTLITVEHMPFAHLCAFLGAASTLSRVFPHHLLLGWLTLTCLSYPVEILLPISFLFWLLFSPNTQNYVRWHSNIFPQLPHLLAIGLLYLNWHIINTMICLLSSCISKVMLVAEINQPRMSVFYQ